MYCELKVEHLTLINRSGESKDIYQLVIDDEVIIALDEHDYLETKKYLEE